MKHNMAVKSFLMVLLVQNATILFALLRPAIVGALPSGRLMCDVLNIWPHSMNGTMGPLHGFSTALNDFRHRIGSQLEKRRKRRAADGSIESAVETDAIEIDDDADEEEDETDRLIRLEEIQTALDEGIEYSQLSEEELSSRGWKLVHSEEKFSLHKRRLNEGKGAVVYLMMGGFDDVSARTFLHSQIDKSCRKEWDVTMAEMSEGEINSACLTAKGRENSHQKQKHATEDILYYRTKWPWPLKDRDYALARRCKLFKRDDAIVFVSRSTEADDIPSKSGVLRVDNYWCHSVFFSTAVDKSKSTAGEVNGQYRSGGSFSDKTFEDAITGGNDAAIGDASASEYQNSESIPEDEIAAAVSFSPRESSQNTMRLVHRLHSIFPTPYSATTVAACATANRHVAAVATASLYREQLYRLPQSSRDVFATLHERYHPKHLIKANMLANLRRAEQQRQDSSRDHHYTIQQQTALRPDSSSVRATIKQPRGSFFRRSFFLMRFGNTDSLRTNAFPGRVKRVSTSMVCDDLPDVGAVDDSSDEMEQSIGRDIKGSDIEMDTACAETFSVTGSKMRNIDKPGMRFVTIFCDDQKVPLPSGVVDILSKHAEKLVPGSVERLHTIARQYQEQLQHEAAPQSQQQSEI